MRRSWRGLIVAIREPIEAHQGVDDMNHEADPAATSREFRIGTRGSGLALAQTGQMADRLRAGGVRVAIEVITTRGDTRGDSSVAALGDDGVFVRELERALLDGRIDIAVHSLKDLPTADVAGLCIACVPERASPFDALVGQPGDTLENLPSGAIVGTSSIRRVVQVKAVRPDLEVRPVRGNVDTRLGRLDRGDYRCLILAAAGLTRLGLGERITRLLTPPHFWPAVGQGALALQTRSGDDEARLALEPLDHRVSHAAVVAERSCLADLAGGCLAPVGGWARLTDGGRLELGARVLESHADGIAEVTAERSEPVDQGRLVGLARSVHNTARRLGRQVAADLLSLGAGEMLERMRLASDESPLR
jgi:hydroxymethylbilane synthase